METDGGFAVAVLLLMDVTPPRRPDHRGQRADGVRAREFEPRPLGLRTGHRDQQPDLRPGDLEGGTNRRERLEAVGDRGETL